MGTPRTVKTRLASYSELFVFGAYTLYNKDMSKILLTGGAGFIGSHIADAYVEAGHNVVVVDDLSVGKKENINKKVKFYKADLRNKRQIKKIFAQEKPEIVNHQAAQKSVNYSVKDPLYDADINIIGFLNLMEAAKESGVKKCIFASTGGAIYGDTKKFPTPEDELPLPASPYGITKLCSENYLRFYFASANIKPVVLRYANVYGPRQDPLGEAGVIAIFSRLILAHKPVTVFGSGKQTRDYVFVADIASASLLALNYEAKNFEEAVFNIGTGEETNLLQIIGYIEEACGKKAQITYAPARQGDIERSAVDAQKAQKMLDWHPQVSLAEGIKKTVYNL